MGVDEAKSVFDKLHDEWSAIRQLIETEQDTGVTPID